MSTAETPCVNTPCNHPKSEHNDADGFCDAGYYNTNDILTRCPCVGFVDQYTRNLFLRRQDDASDDTERCRICGGDDRYCPCTTGYSSTYFTRSML